MFCREQAARVDALAPALARHGVVVAFVGLGDAASARTFAADLHLQSPVYVTTDAHQALGFRRGLGATLGPASLIHALRARKAGFRNGPITGDALQQGGVLLLRADGTTAWAYRARQAGDHPADELLLAEAAKLG